MESAVSSLPLQTKVFLKKTFSSNSKFAVTVKTAPSFFFSLEARGRYIHPCAMKCLLDLAHSEISLKKSDKPLCQFVASENTTPVPEEMHS